MSPRGRINQHEQDWINQMSQTSTPQKPTQTQPDTADGVDLGFLIVAGWAICFIAGVVVQRIFG